MGVGHVGIRFYSATISPKANSILWYRLYRSGPGQLASDVPLPGGLVAATTTARLRSWPSRAARAIIRGSKSGAAGRTMDAVFVSDSNRTMEAVVTVAGGAALYLGGDRGHLHAAHIQDRAKRDRSRHGKAFPFRCHLCLRPGGTL